MNSASDGLVAALLREQERDRAQRRRHTLLGALARGLCGPNLQPGINLVAAVAVAASRTTASRNCRSLAPLSRA